MPPLNIAVLAHLHHPIASPYCGGLEMHTALLAEELTKHGHNVTLFAKAGSRTPARLRTILDADFAFTRHPEGSLRDAQSQLLDDSLGRAIDEIRDGEFDVVVNNSLSPLPYIEPTGVPMLTILHTPKLPQIIDALESTQWKQTQTHKFVSVSASNARLWDQHIDGIEVIHNGIRLESWARAANRRRKSGTAVWAGRITPEKGLHVAIEAARSAGMKLSFAGPISDAEYFDQTVRPLMDDRMRYAGHLEHDELAAFFGSGEVFIASPVWAEPFGLTVVEAMACGTPVAALPGGAMAEIIDDDGGVVSEDFSAGGLAEAIRLARRRNRRDVRASASRFAAERMILQYNSLLRQLASHSAVDSAGALVP